jgi:hypothetical protein
MDTMSARDWDAFDAAGSRKWILNGTADVMSAIKEQWDARSQNIGAPPAESERGDILPVSIYDDSAGAVAPGVFQAIIEAKFVEAKEASFQALTSTPGASGWSKEMSYAEIKAPYLARRASYRQASEQTAVHFFEQRMGGQPSGFAAYSEQYNLSPVTDEIERAFDAMRTNALRSPTLEPRMMLALLKQRLGGLPSAPAQPGGAQIDPAADEAQILAELRQSAETAQRSAEQGAALAASFGGAL